MAKVGLRYGVFSFDPFPYFVHCRDGGEAGLFTTHVDDISGCEEQGVLSTTEVFSEARLGQLQVQETSSVRGGMDIPQGNDHSVLLTREEFPCKIQPLGTSPELWAARQQLLPPEDGLRFRRKSGALCW